MSGSKQIDTRYTQERELSWLRFDQRVMDEARDESVPLFERLKFLSIFTSNLDEFFMIRVGSISDMTLSRQAHMDSKSGLTPAQLDLYAVTNGPGSFTGLRIGLAAVKGLAFAANTPCAGVSTMAALAYGVCGEGTVIGAQDARRGQVYWAGFDLATHARLTPDAAEPVTALETFVKECKKPLIFVGDGAALCYNTYKDQPGILPCPQPLRVLRGAGVALAGKAMWDAGTCVSPAELLPDYHRLSQAERERAEREAAQQSATN